MRSLLFFVLASYAVRCDDSSYYVVEMPEIQDENPTRIYRKPFKVYWNVPTKQCRSKKIPFENLNEKFGIIQNTNDSFLGDKISILYDPGLFPALLKNETSGKFKFRNGGVPQEGDLDVHIAAFKKSVDIGIPDPDFSGIGIIDFESWRPVFRQNFGVLVTYKDISYEIEKKLHWWWPKQKIQSKAKQRFEEAARLFMQTTLSVAKEMRPNALWGYYGFPYCFNMASNNKQEACSSKVSQENDGIFWLWSESTAIYPSVYSSKDLTSSQLASLIKGRLQEAARVKRRNIPILPYFWFRYRDGEYLSKVDLDIALRTMYKSNASGFIVWGSSKDVNTVDKCTQLRNYVENTFGPAIAKYTKTESKLYINKLEDIATVDQNFEFQLPNTMNDISSIHANETTFVLNNTKSSTLDPEFHWDPPENYTEDIVQYVQDHLNRNSKYNSSLENTTVNPNNNMYTDSVFSTISDDEESIENESGISSGDSTNENVKRDVSTTEQYTISTTDYSTSDVTTEYNIDTTTVIDLSTIVSVKLSKNQEGTPQTSLYIDSLNEDTTTKYYNTGSTTIRNEDYEENIYDSFLNDTFSENSEENSTIVHNRNNTESVLVTINGIISKNEKKGYAKKTTSVTSEAVGSSAQPYEVETSTQSNDITYNFGAKDRKKGLPINTNKSSDPDTNDTRPEVHTIFVEQVVV